MQDPACNYTWTYDIYMTPTDSVSEEGPQLNSFESLDKAVDIDPTIFQSLDNEKRYATFSSSAE